MSLVIKISNTDKESCLIKIDGRLDTQTYQQAEKELAAIISAPPKRLIMDFANLDFISSMGIRVILKTRKAIETAGGKVLTTNLQPQIAKVFEIVAALPKEAIFSSVEEADRYFATMQRQELEKDNS